MTAPYIYLDNSMTTRPSDKAVSALLPFLTHKWGSPSAPHLKGQELFPDIKDSLQAIYALIGAKEKDSVVFTSSGAEAINHALCSTYFDVTRTTGKNQFITSQIDEAPTILCIGRLEQMGCVGKMVQPDKNGKVTAEAIAETISPRTAMVSLSWANGMTGVIQPVAEIASLCKERGIRLHLDATHVLGKLFYNLEDIEADFISFNGDHLHAPKGTGGLYVKEGVACSPFIVGGLEQAGQRAGSYSVGGLASLGCAAKEAIEARDYICTEIARLRDKLEQGILTSYPEAVLFFGNQERLPHCTVIGFPGIVNEALLYALNRKQLFASIGGGCFQQIALLLTASGISEPLAQSAVHFSLSRETTEEEIDRAIEIIVDTAKKLRKLSSTLPLRSLT